MLSTQIASAEAVWNSIRQLVPCAGISYFKELFASGAVSGSWDKPTLDDDFDHELAQALFKSQPGLKLDDANRSSRG